MIWSIDLIIAHLHICAHNMTYDTLTLVLSRYNWEALVWLKSCTDPELFQAEEQAGNSGFIQINNNTVLHRLRALYWWFRVLQSLRWKLMTILLSHTFSEICQFDWVTMKLLPGRSISQQQWALSGTTVYLLHYFIKPGWHQQSKKQHRRIHPQSFIALILLLMSFSIQNIIV